MSEKTARLTITCLDLRLRIKSAGSAALICRFKFSINICFATLRWACSCHVQAGPVLKRQQECLQTRCDACFLFAGELVWRNCELGSAVPVICWLSLWRRHDRDLVLSTKYKDKIISFQKARTQPKWECPLFCVPFVIPSKKIVCALLCNQNFPPPQECPSRVILD